MKKLLLPFLSILILAACNNKPSVNIITVIDNGTTYTDTFSHVMGFEGGTIAPNEAQQDKLEINTEGTGTGRFAHKTIKNHPTPADTLDYYCDIQKTGNNSMFTMAVTGRNGFPIFLTLAAAGPASGVGAFKGKGAPISQKPGSTSADTLDERAFTPTFKEAFNGGQEYTVDSVAVNIKESSSKPGRGTSVKGDYQMWVSNASGSKTVSGIIDCKTGYRTR